MMKPWIISLDSPLALRERYAGGKGASLARLRREQFNVPPGFVITPQAFTAFLTSFQVAIITQKHAWSPSELKLITSFIRESPMPGRLARAIVRAYRRHHGAAPVAVRSSMIGEDQAAASFAGQLDTILNVTGEAQLLPAVKRCWASLFNERLLDYLAEREQMAVTALLSSLSIAVVVQQMVPAQAAGVAFSADPITGERCTIIEAVAGLGDALVAGRAEPDRYVMDTRDVCRSVTLTGAEPVLPEGVASVLAQQVQAVARKACAPQDVEWAWDGVYPQAENGQGLYLLQCRPITSLAGKRIYTSSMVGEMLPGLIKPLVWSVSAQQKLEHVLGRIFTEILGPNDLDFSELATCIHGRIYADATMLGELLERMGLPPNFFEMMSRDERAGHQARPPMNGRTLRTMVRIGRFAWRYANVADEIAAYLDRHTVALASYRSVDWKALETPSLWAEIEALCALYAESLWYNFIGPINMMLRNRLLGHMVNLWAPDVQPNDLVCGLVGMKSLESGWALRRLAEQARRLDEDDLALMATGSDTAIRAEFVKTGAGRAMVEAVAGFLDDYGYLSAAGTDLSRTPWVESPTMIWQAIARMARHVGGDGARSAGQMSRPERAAARQAAQDRVRRSLGWWRHYRFARVLKSTTTYITLRERTSFLISEDSYHLRRAFLALAGRAVERGLLRNRDDVFYLFLDEVRQLVGGGLSASTIHVRVEQRRAALVADAALELPDTLCGEMVDTTILPACDTQDYLTGIVGSAGVAMGTAHIILDPAHAPVSLSSGAILVVPFTDVSWTPLFVGAGGVVTETGGQLSHSAIVAREYGLPAVVNVKNATRLIQDGQRIVVDGNQGRVYLKARGHEM